MDIVSTYVVLSFLRSKMAAMPSVNKHPAPNMKYDLASESAAYRKSQTIVTAGSDGVSGSIRMQHTTAELLG